MTSQGIVFKNSKTGKLDQIQGHDLETVNWQRIAAGFGLRIMTRNGALYRFGGFNESDYDRVVAYFRNQFDINVKEKEFCLKGWNWGVTNFQGSALSFDIEQNKTAFEVPLGNVSHCTTAKNEVTLEFHQNDDAPVALMELRFHIPNPTDSSEDPVTAFMNSVLSKADIIQATGDAIVTFTELQCLTPRGRYDIKLFPTFIQLHGKTFDYKIPLTTVLRLFRLPHKDQRQVFFVLSLDPPIKQGQTRYHFLILLFNKEEEVTVELNITDEVRDRFEGKIDTPLTGATVDVLSRVMKLLVQRKITFPSESFGGSQPPVISCSYKAGAGLMYPLDRGFIYIHKPPVHIRFEEILSINFARSGGSTRSFDFEVETKAGIVHTFSSIEKEEYAKLYDFVTSKKLRVKNTGSAAAATKEKDEDDLIDSDIEGGEPDAYLARVKQEGKERDEDSDESDESFNPGNEDSDVAEEFDSNASESESEVDSDDSAAKQRKEKKQKRKEKERKKEKEPKKREKKSKKEKDSDKPKKPMSAYFLWLQETRSELKEKYPNLSMTELVKKAGEIWKDKVPDKSKWEKAAAEAKAKYKEDLAEYEARGGGDSSPKKSSKKEKAKKEKSPKKPSPTKSSQNKNMSFKSKEFIDSDDDSSSDSDNEKKKAEAKKAKASKSSPNKKSKKDSSDEDAEMPSEEEESAEETPSSSDSD